MADFDKVQSAKKTIPKEKENNFLGGINHIFHMVPSIEVCGEKKLSLAYFT